MASAAGVTEEAKAVSWLRFNSGAPVPVDDGEGEASADLSGMAAETAAVSERRATYAVAGYEDAKMEMERGDGNAEAVAKGVKAEMAARGGGEAETEAAGAGGKRRSSPRFADRAALDGDFRRKKAIAKRVRLKFDGVEVQSDISQAQSPHPVLRSPEQVYEENKNLKLQLSLKTIELEQEENRRLQKENESLQKKIEELEAENGQLKKNAKPQRVARLCSSCNTRGMHDYRNCPKRRRAASFPEEEDTVDPY